METNAVFFQSFFVLASRVNVLEGLRTHESAGSLAKVICTDASLQISSAHWQQPNQQQGTVEKVIQLYFYYMESTIVAGSVFTLQPTYRSVTSCQGSTPTATRTLSERPRKRMEQEWANRTVSRANPQNLTFLLMKDKFQRIYKDIQRIALKDEHISLKQDRKEAGKEKKAPEESKQDIPQDQPTLSVSSLHLTPAPHPQTRPQQQSQIHTKLNISNDSESSLQISTREERKGTAKGYSMRQQMRRTRYRKKVLDPISVDRVKLSNNIRDYLSVEKISTREPEETRPSRTKLLRRTTQPSPNPFQSQICSSEISLEVAKQKKIQQIIVRKGTNKFKPPFPLYYYRDFMWKVAYSHEFMVEAVEEYETKLKYFVGPGNNSNLIKGLMRRRPWFQITEKPQDAHFVWTQIKLPSLFSTQKKAKTPISISKPANQTTSDNSILFLNSFEREKWKEYWSKHMERQRMMKETLRGRTRVFSLLQHSLEEVRTFHIHNHFCYNFLIGNKKALFQTMREYYSSRGQQVFDHLPLTFHIKNGLQDDQYLTFLQHYYAISRENKGRKGQYPHNAWIVKPGENTNRGNGIMVCLQLGEIKAMLRRKERHGDGTYKTYILQKYIERPLLYRKRKFDLRHYIMLTSFHGCRKGYWYRYGYVRTTSAEYSLAGTAGAVHLTNDAVQKTLPDYGRFEKGNKITYDDLDAYLKKNDPAFDFHRIVYPQMKEAATSVIHASAANLDPDRRSSNFEVFGLDFMVDADYRVWLIEVNTNPCLETTCPVLSQVIPTLLEHAFQITLDPLFPAPLGFEPSYQPYYSNMGEQNGFQLVYDQRIDGAGSSSGLLGDLLQEEEQVFDDDGENFED